MVIIQIVIIAIALGLLLFVFSGKQTYTVRAWKKIAFCFLIFLMIVAVIFPEMVNQIAHLFGVGRGADLLLYILVLSFIGYVVNDYIHRQNEKDVIYRLARKLALLEANSKLDIKNKK